MAADGFCECGCGGKAPISDRTQASRGVKLGEPVRFIVGHSRRGRRRTRYEVRDCGYLTPCWVWLLALNKETGYGYETYGDLAHRATYVQSNGAIPEGMQLDHLCRNRACVNPEHLEPVTNAVNTRRGARTKLSSEDVAAIRASGLAQGKLAEIYGVHSAHISKIQAGKIWVAA